MSKRIYTDPKTGKREEVKVMGIEHHTGIARIEKFGFILDVSVRDIAVAMPTAAPAREILIGADHYNQLAGVR